MFSEVLPKLVWRTLEPNKESEDEDTAEGIRIDGVGLGLSQTLEDGGVEANVIEIFADRLEINLGVRKIDGLGCSSGDGRVTGKQDERRGPQH